MTDSTWIALGALGQWFAGIATFFAVWVAIKSSRPKAKATQNIRIIVQGTYRDPNSYLAFNLTNTGTLPTTISGLAILVAPTKYVFFLARIFPSWSWLSRNLRVVSLLCLSPYGVKFPHLLNPGEAIQPLAALSNIFDALEESYPILYIHSSFYDSSGSSFTTKILKVIPSDIPPFDENSSVWTGSVGLQKRIT